MDGSVAWVGRSDPARTNNNAIGRKRTTGNLIAFGISNRVAGSDDVGRANGLSETLL